MRSVLLIGLGALLAGCGKAAAPQDSSAAAPLAQPGAYRFLALGDSYTIGESVEPSVRWPVQLSAALRRAAVNIADPEIIARTGWTTGNLSAAIDQANPRGPYDLVALLIGVNNQFQGRSEDEYRRQFADLLARSISLAGGRASHVIVLSIPDWGVTPYAKDAGVDPVAVGAAIDRFNVINKEISDKAGVAYVDITPLTRQRRDLVAEDGLHPSGAMYGKWIELALPAAFKALGK